MFAPDWYSHEKAIYFTTYDLPYINLLATIVVSLLLTIAVYNYIWKELPSSPKERNFLVTQTALWCGVVVMLQVNCLSLYYEVQALSTWCTEKTCSGESSATAKTWLIIFIATGSIFWLVVFSLYSIKKIIPQELLSPGIQPFLIGIPLLNNVAVLFAILFYIIMCLSQTL